MLGLDVGEAEAAAEQLLLLGQLEDGVGGEAGLEEGGLGGTDGDHTCSQQWLDVAGAENTKTLASAQLISAEQLSQHAELTSVRSSGIWGFGLAAAVGKPVNQVSRLELGASVL